MADDPGSPATEDQREVETGQSVAPERRRLLGSISGAAMAAGLVGGYGAFGLIAGRYLYPARPTELIWQYVARVVDLAPGASILYRGPSGETVNVVRQAANGDADDFIALSSTCPHLGCQVHWEPQNDRYFCPCHNGVFDPAGVATEGPPAEAGQSLPRYRLRIDGGLLYIEVPAEQLVDGGSSASPRVAAGGISKPGHDRCLEGGARAGRDDKA